MNNQQFIEELKKINIDITDNQLNKLNQYYQLLIEENKKINLTGITEYNLVYLKHFYDSLTINKIEKLESQKLCDIGTGAGFPGIVLKIIFPNLKITLVESLTKRCKFLNKVIANLELKEIEVINERAEVYSKKQREKFDIVTSRAVANIKQLLEYSIPLLKIDGLFIAMKGNVTEEMKDIDNCLNELKSQIIEIKKFNLPIENSERTLIKIIKTAKTPNMYPRNYSQIIKKPL